MTARTLLRTDPGVPATGCHDGPSPAPRAREALLEWARLAVAATARVVLLAALGSLFWAAAPAAIGWKPTTVMSDSMAPRFVAGDVVVARPVPRTTDLVGRVILFDDPDHAGRLRLHRAVSADPSDTIVTRGDANRTDDSSHITRDAVRGVAVLRIPGAGLPILWAKRGDILPIALLALAAAALVGLSTVDGRLRRGEAERAPSPRARIGLPLAATAAVVTLALVVGTGAHARFTATTATPAGSWTAAADFACWSGSTPPDSPSFYYRGDESSGTRVTDASGNGRTGDMRKGATRRAGACPGVKGGGGTPSIAFDGTPDAQIVPAAVGPAPAPTSFSIETWLSTTSTSSGKLIGFETSKDGGSRECDRHLYLSTSGEIVFGVYAGSARTIASAPGLNDGTWHHAIATLGGTGMRLYIDGALVASDSTVTTAFTYPDGGYWRIGHSTFSGWPRTASATGGLVGAMDDIAVYPSVLTAAQVSSHYATGH